ncbi:hypothetical protein [Vibrio vulnificus]|uniref:hypothetical protein n=1 Tax=Vibrio vulnificus TaxID=672 RepID=UPI000D3E7C23|nr:hypothetical protein [Vibrio vulnificus]MBN8142997.1 hypothetical protein [Vibrio vulnificus]MBN8152265.1 hypothetical protein [Vibrio vulnificus]NIG89968.1 hypothetical protein [Vibrio vulnificus]PUZ78760.1 hypothetical protein DC357_22360 [Vibrio vulnificus]
MHKHQDPMTGIRILEEQLAEGFVMKRVPFTDDIYMIKDNPFGGLRYTYAKLNKKNVEHLVSFDMNDPLNGKPCFCLYYGTQEHLRNKGLTVKFVEQAIALFKKELPKKFKPFYIEALVEKDIEASLGVATRLFGEKTTSGVCEHTGAKTDIWQVEYAG